MKEYTNNTKRIGKRIMCTTRPESRAGRVIVRLCTILPGQGTCTVVGTVPSCALFSGKH